MDVLHFPKNDGSVKEGYYNAYYAFVRRWALAAGIEVIDTKTDKVWCGRSINTFSCVYNDAQFVMDFSDFKKFQMNPVEFDCPYFKWHYSYDCLGHLKTKNVYPLSILLGFAWKQFCECRKLVTYKANGNKILNNQRPRHAAAKRRTFVHEMLTEKYGKDLSKGYIGQTDWWLSHNDCLVAVVVPGARNDMLDRGHFEEMGLGICIICPEIVTVLLRNLVLEPFKHYVPVEPDYSDLIEKIEWCKQHRDECIHIGNQARILFDKVANPHKYWTYIREILHGYSEHLYNVEK